MNRFHVFLIPQDGRIPCERYRRSQSSVEFSTIVFFPYLPIHLLCHLKPGSTYLLLVRNRLLSGNYLLCLTVSDLQESYVMSLGPLFMSSSLHPSFLLLFVIIPIDLIPDAVSCTQSPLTSLANKFVRIVPRNSSYSFVITSMKNHRILSHKVCITCCAFSHFPSRLSRTCGVMSEVEGHSAC